jgi:hypothetical protein
MPKADAVAFFSRLFGGKHHIPGKRYGEEANVKEFGYGWCVLADMDLSTWDMDRLTQAVFMAHDCHYRLEISPAMRYLRIAIHPRVPIAEAGDSPIMSGHPSLSEAIERWRKRNPLEVRHD